MDLSKVERQTPAGERNSKPPNYMRILLLDMICFFVLLSVALLIVAAILYVADDVTRFQYRPRDPINASRAVSMEEAHKHMHRVLKPETWFRLFNCQKQQDERMLQLHERSQRPEQEQVLGEGQGDGLTLNQPAKQKELDEQQTFGPYFAPTYGPNNHPEHNRLQAGGDNVVQDSASNQLESKPEPHFEFF